MKEGWECPKCGAVMAPDEKVCVNCKGNVVPMPSYPLCPCYPVVYPAVPVVIYGTGVPNVEWVTKYTITGGTSAPKA